MSTRATYTFQPSRYSLCNRPVSFYIHYDGYLEGAAIYLTECFADSRGSAADKFHRLNELAELTGSHETHGDRGFQYTISEKENKIYLVAERVEYRNHTDTVKVCKPVFTGYLEDFVNKYNKSEDPRLPVLDQRFTTDWVKTFNERLDYAVHCLEKGWSGNGFRAIEDAIKIAEKLEFSSEVKVYLQVINEIYTDRFRARLISPEDGLEKAREAYQAITVIRQGLSAA